MEKRAHGRAHGFWVKQVRATFAQQYDCGIEPGCGANNGAHISRIGNAIQRHHNRASGKADLIDMVFFPARRSNYTLAVNRVRDSLNVAIRRMKQSRASALEPFGQSGNFRVQGFIRRNQNVLDFHSGLRKLFAKAVSFNQKQPRFPSPLARSQ
ncbi:MAG: hypothetical protein ABIH03_14375 [Pseudomonadota bacterium]